LIPNPVQAVEIPGIEQAALNYQNPEDPDQVSLFQSGLTNTLRQSKRTSDGTVYVQTGDIPAEWQRDASAQVRPYLLFAKTDPQVAVFLRAVIAREGKNLRKDPYANAFTDDYRVWEEKFELDSLAYPILLAWTYWKVTDDRSIFTPDLSLAFDQALHTMIVEQHHNQRSNYKNHTGMPNKGLGNPVVYTGMIWSGYRPSDDPCMYNYLIPSEMMAVQALAALAEIEQSVYHDRTKAQKSMSLRLAVHDGIQRYGIVHTAKYGDVYAYEVDGHGNNLLLDDANIPSLLSAPYLGYGTANDITYQNTRKFVLSSDNPNYHVGTIARGIGSEHTHNNYIWPLSLLMQGFTSQSQSETDGVMDEVIASSTAEHVLYESFDPNDSRRYTRKDFGWPNALFAEFVLTHLQGKPALPLPTTGDLQFRKH
jgi:meiotically up-regulated gene 157 (Mug157) protein